MFNLMLSNPFKYDIIDKIKKYSFLKVLLELVFKNNQNDIFLNAVNQIFVTIFKSQINIAFQTIAVSQSSVCVTNNK